MARRDFRQLGLADSIVQRRGKKTAWLERLDAALDWSALEVIVEGVAESGVKRNIPGPCGKALAVSGNPG